MSAGARDANELVEAARGGVTGCQDSRRDDAVVAARLVGEVVAEPALAELAVDALPLGFGKHRRREIEAVERREACVGESHTEETRSRANVEDAGLCRKKPPRDPGDGGRRSVAHAVDELVVVRGGDSLVLAAQLVDAPRSVEPVEIHR